ncbi:MAG: zinc ribbon domain-containing protein [Armatimonadetes bacterium]|nr:zinc ribbon domain-containing protein [Armatimonadota bacterium]
MNQPSERIECSNCHAMNPPDAESCWQCGQPLRAEDVSPAHEPSPREREISGTSQVSQGSTPGRDTKIYIILGWIFVAIGLVFCCYILPAVGIALGLVAYSKGDNRGLIIAIAGLIVLVLTSTVLIIYLTTKMRPSVLLPVWI